DQAGPMTRSAEDAALLMNILAGHDPKDSTSIERDVPDYTAELQNSIAGLRIGLPREFMNDQLDAGIAGLIQQALQQLRSQGAILVDIDLPHVAHSVPAYYVIAPAEASSNLSRFDGVRFGHRCEMPRDLEDLYKRSRSEGFGTEVKRRIMIGTYALSTGYYDAYYLKAQQIRRLIKQDFIQAFTQCDVILGPTSPSLAFPLADRQNDPVSMYLSDIYTIAVNLAGLPGMSLPCGFLQGLPVGMQLIGPYWSEERLLNVAHRYQLACPWHQQMPASFA
ncbi:MAG: Asp-tRNA(Asn)/Glu-tRNA(Gln) amidotransferase subunit GatA, partial [Pseudomonadales bacterium]|nr:Asp-tRNA(Asn)/Glu-tRNA(Gln) amidotransferase subunit GatA [Pseudomonadales bacterium]